MICFRYFKEARNSLIHGSGKAEQNLLKAQTAFAKLGTTDLDVVEVPVYEPLVVGRPVKLQLRGVVGFGDIVLRLICTLDAELSKSKHAEQVFIVRWREAHGKGVISIANDPLRRTARIKRLVREMHLPTPKVSSDLESWLKSERLIF
jgi:hypothetical protein